jgi:type II secretory pathway component GspD/PulD (secretin)
MKTLMTRALGAACAVGCLAGALVAQDTAAPTTDAKVPTRSENAPTETTSTPVPTPASNGGSTGIQMNFRNAPLEQVLEYLSEAAGFIIVLDAPVKGTVNVISAKPMSQDEAVDFLSSVLNKNGLAAIRDGRTLTIVDRTAAKTRDIPVKVNNDPRMIPKNDEIVTQIIPIRYVEADQLAKDLASFISPQATFVANAAGNSIVMTDTQANIRHMVEIIKAIDSSAEAETEIRVFHLTHASPSDVATALSGVFPSSSSSGNNNQAPVRFGGGPFGGGGGFGGMMGGFGGGGGGGGGGRGGGGGGGGGNSASGQNDRIRRASQVMAVPDGRTSSVIVTASKNLMSQIAGMVRELDVPSIRDQQVHVFRMNNGDPQQAVQVLQNMFQSTTSGRTGTSGTSQNSALMQRQQNNNQTTGSSSSGSGTFGNSGGGGRSGGQLF